MSSKFIEAPGLASDLEAKLAEYGVTVDVSEIGIAVTLSLVTMGLVRSVFWTS